VTTVFSQDAVTFKALGKFEETADKNNLGLHHRSPCRRYVALRLWNLTASGYQRKTVKLRQFLKEAYRICLIVGWSVFGYDGK